MDVTRQDNRRCPTQISRIMKQPLKRNKFPSLQRLATKRQFIYLSNKNKLQSASRSHQTYFSARPRSVLAQTELEQKLKKTQPKKQNLQITSLFPSHTSSTLSPPPTPPPPPPPLPLHTLINTQSFSCITEPFEDRTDKDG